MKINRRLLTGAMLALAASPAMAATSDEDTVRAKVEAFRAAQFAADPKALDPLCAPQLSYSHSDAHIEDKTVFIANATSGKSKFTSLEYRDLTVRVVGTAAIVRFHWVGHSVAKADGKESDTSLAVLMTWQKQGTAWKLLDRASTKV